MYNTLDNINFIDSSDTDEENYSILNNIYCECENCYNYSTRELFNDYYCDECYPNFNIKEINDDIIKNIYKQGIDNTYPCNGNNIKFNYKIFLIDELGEHEFYNSYKKGFKEIILGDKRNLNIFNTIIKSMNKKEQSVFITNISQIEKLKKIINENNFDENNFDENNFDENNFELYNNNKFKIEIEIIDITKPIRFNNKIII
tara:strand:- start:128 stop:733 length:606 start_codon:yes stop_codon:yes gene_type:complete